MVASITHDGVKELAVPTANMGTVDYREFVFNFENIFYRNRRLHFTSAMPLYRYLVREKTG